MNHIQVLDKYTANRIAAGEVVERPASVVKELLENAIDAGASAITIETTGGGLESIRVSDNGSGIPADELATAFLPHATSKIASSEDLFSIKTLGFRGEALPSIAAVSKVTVRTKCADAPNGALLRIEGGDIIENHEAGVPDGTTVECNDLFYNVPARLKFIKNARTESAAITDYVSRMIMCRPDIRIKLIQSGRTVLHSDGSGELDGAIECVYGNDIMTQLQEVHYKDAYITFAGYISKEQFSRPNRTTQSFYVNCRYIHSPRLAFAIQRAYDNRLMQGRFPFAVIHVNIAPGEVDVNVHPNKLEVRFRQEDRVLGPLVTQCRHMLEDPTYSKYEMEPIEDPKPKFVIADKEKILSRLKYLAETETAVTAAEKEFSRQAENKLELNAMPREAFVQNQDDNAKAAVHDNKPHTASIFTFEMPQQQGFDVSTKEVNDARSAFSPVQQKVDFSQYEIIGQLFNCYWAIQRENEVIFIDQHAMHERRLYEKIIQKDIPADSQQLLTPVIVRLSPLEYSILIDNLERFKEIGFDISEFGILSISVRAVPAVIEYKDIKRFIMDAIAMLDAKNRLTTVDMKRDALIKRACRSAIKAGEKIDESELRALLEQFDNENVPLTCPHGRPVMMRMTKADFEKLFKRSI